MVTVAVFVCDAIRSRDRLTRMMRVLVACLAVVSFVGLVQFALGIDLASYVNLPGLRIQENAYAAFETRSVFRRPSGTVNHPIEYGLICAMAVPMAAHFVFQARQRDEPVGRWVLCLALVGLGAMLSLSRTAIIGLVVAAIVMGVMLPRRQGVPLLAVGATAFVGASAIVPGLFGTLSSMFSNIQDDPSFQGRTKDYDGAWKDIALHPWLGRGFGTYLPSKNPILDNQYLLTMIENGYLGLCAFAGLFMIAIYAAFKARSLTKDENLRGIATCLVCATLIGALGAATFDLLSFSVATGLLFVVVGASGALLRIARAEAAVEVPNKAAANA
jgi:O-antigen ligase